MRGPLARTFLATSLAFASVSSVLAGSNDPPSNPPCSQPNVVKAAAPNVVVEVPPPNVVIRANQSAACSEKECWLKRCCHFGCKQAVYVQQMMMPAVGVQPLAPMPYQPMSIAPMAPMPYQPFSMAPMAYPPMNLQPLSLSIVPSAPTAPAAPDAATMDVNQALRKITLQLDTLTKVVEKHNDFLTSHEKRIQRLETWLGNKDNLGKPLPALKPEDH
jgi:hypothetical protein